MTDESAADRWRASSARITVLLSLFAATGCIGELRSADDDSSATTGDGVTGDGDLLNPGGVSATCDGDPLASTVRRLNVVELNHVAWDVFANDAEPFLGLRGDPVGFKTVGSSLGTATLFTDDYIDRIEVLSEGVAVDLAASTVCDFSTNAAACGVEVLEPYARRLFRRPPSEAFLSGLGETVAKVAGHEGLTPVDGLQAGLMALLASPHFLFTDVDDSVPQTRPASSYEMAERLALSLWLSVPDAELMAAADADLLLQESAVAAQVDRMLADPKATRFMTAFAEQWLALDSIGAGRVDAGAHGLDEAEWGLVVEDMKTETREFVRYVFSSGMDVSALLSARFSILNDRLANFYGVPLSGAPGFSLHNFPADSTRQGVLTQGAILLQGASGTHPEIVKRGATVVNRFLCRPPPTPPESVNEQVELQLASDTTERERMLQRSETPACAGCHVELDPLGYSFHSFDAVGRFRTIDDDGSPIDTTIEYKGDIYAGAGEVLDFLGEEGIEPCLTQNLLTFTLGRDFNISDNKEDACLVDDLVTAAPDKQFMSLVRTLLTSPLYRSHSVAE